MEELAVNEKESKLLEINRQLNETNQKQQAELNEKEILIKSLEKRIAHLESGGGVETAVNFLQGEEDVSLDSQPMEMDLTNCENSENESKKMKGESGQMNEPTNSDDSSAQFKALRNPLILTKILRSMRTRDLIQNSRLVNREWRDLSTDILLKRKNIQVSLRQDDSRFVLARKNDPYTKQIPEKNLGELTSLLSTSATFPFVNFSFHGNLKMGDAQTFLSEFGSNIKGLNLVGKQDVKLMRKLFVKQAPNLENLELQYVKVEGESFSKEFPAPKLSSLMTLQLWDKTSTPLVKIILEAAPNLQNCTGPWSMEQIELLSPRINIVMGLILQPGPEDVELFEKLTKMKFQLKYFKMDYDALYLDEELEIENEELVAKFDGINSKMLSLNRTTLQEIHLTPHLYFDSVIKWPELLNVVKLTIEGDKNFVLNYPSFKMSEKFPNIHTLCIKCTEDSKNDDASGLFKDVVPSIKTLSVDGYFMKTFPQYYNKFPNIQDLTLEGIENDDFPSIAPLIWNMKKLKSLKLEFWICTTSIIDAGFTGMEIGMCRFIENLGGEKVEVVDMEEFRVNPSILNLTELEKLNLGYFNDPIQNPRIASSVSFEYALNLMPQLRVSQYLY